ncbi:hypothetical protein J5N97_016080 [Dioscorea zingiberensis]|uniref:Dilute domain-containing protein n=1 Tax=Dioscorea zingiberensis TaxID=325984 RepID=A0A9D5HF26_9LILI|nr:hypothetical protein J5N97_016080 [Dioscorea zingiberensis]
MAELDARRIEVLANAARLIQRQIEHTSQGRSSSFPRKATIQMQKALERLETNMSSLESENQVLWQQALVASTNEDMSEEIKSLREQDRCIGVGESVAPCSQPVEVTQPLITPQLATTEPTQPPTLLKDQSFENGHQEREESKTNTKIHGTSWDELQHIRQAVGFLTLHQKTHKTMEEITNELCPVLSVAQIYRIGTMFWDDKYGTQGLSKDVIAKMRTMMTDDSTNNNTFLLDDDSSIPFSLDDISRSVLDINLSDVEPPPLPVTELRIPFLIATAHRLRGFKPFSSLYF